MLLFQDSVILLSKNLNTWLERVLFGIYAVFLGLFDRKYKINYIRHYCIFYKYLNTWLSMNIRTPYSFEHHEYLVTLIVYHIRPKTWVGPIDYSMRWCVKCNVEMVNSVNSDQTAPLRSSLIWVYTVCSNLSVWISRVFTVLFKLLSCHSQ